MAYSLDTFRADVVSHLSDDPTSIISVDTMLSFARPLLENVANCYPTLTERLKYLVETISATCMSINANVEFARFGIIKFSDGTDAELCDSMELKQFLETHNLIYKTLRKDRYGVIQESKKIDTIVAKRLQMLDLCNQSTRSNWVRNRSTDMIFVSPFTLMLAIMYGESVDEFKQYTSILQMMLLIVETEQAVAIKATADKQIAIINELIKERDELLVQLDKPNLPSRQSQGWIIKSLVAIASLSITSLLMHFHRPSEHFICQRFQLDSSAWNDKPVLQLLGEPADNTLFSNIPKQQTLAVCARFTLDEALVWKSQFAAVTHSTTSYSVDYIS